MISFIYWRKAEAVKKYLKNGGLNKILIIDGDGEIREGSFRNGMFECDSEGEAWAWSAMEPQPKYFAFKPKAIKFWWDK